MKKKFSNLSKEQQEKREAQYHRMKPQEFDQLMASEQKWCQPCVIDLKQNPKSLPAVRQAGESRKRPRGAKQAAAK